MKVYISGPIMALHLGEHPPRDIIEMRKERFNRCAEWIRANRPGWEPVNPLEVQACEDRSCLDGEEDPHEDMHSWQCWLRYDLIEMLRCDGIVFLPGSDDSPGAQLERHVAESIGMRPYWANEDGEILI